VFQQPRSFSETRTTSRTKDGQTIPRAIQLYRFWYLYLRVALELEDNDFCFREYQQLKDKNGNVTGRRALDEKVKVNRKKYVEWNVDDILTTTFDKWWKEHKYLFVDEPTVELFLDKKSVSSQIRHIQGATQYRYFRVDRRKSITDTLNEMKQHLKDEKRRRRVGSQSKWLITGEMRQEALFNRYNALIMNLEGMKAPDVLMSGVFRRSRQSDVVRYTEDKENTDMYQRNSQKMRDLLKPARRIILSVSDGHFMMSPKWDQYFNRKRKH
jgi:hypothetical protein